MQPILLFDGATENQYAAIIGPVNYLLKQRSRNQSADLLPLIDAILKNGHLTANDLGGLVVGTGPGSFTGVRVVLTTARTMAQVLQLKIISISSLELAYWAHLPQTNADQLWVPFWDGRKGKVYAAGFNSQGEIQFGPGDYTPEQLEKQVDRVSDKFNKEICLFNPDPEWYEGSRAKQPSLGPLQSVLKQLSWQDDLFLQRIAERIGQSANWLPYEEVVPDYLRDPDVVYNG